MNARIEDGAHVRRSRATLVALAVAAIIILLVLADMVGVVSFISTPDDVAASPSGAWVEEAGETKEFRA